jgi:glycosyltransferase involved in cell wall biosynthesis
VGTDAKGIARDADQRFSECVTDACLPPPLRRIEHLRGVWQWLAIPRGLRAFRADVHHCPLNVAVPPWCTHDNTVVTLHDVSFLTLPERRDNPRFKLDRVLCRRGLRFVRKFITDSAYSKEAIVNCLQVDPDRIAVVYLGIDLQEFHPQPTACPANALSRLPAAYLFYPAATWPHKNHARLLQALALVRDRKALAIPLVLTGFPETAHAEVRDWLRKLDLERQVLWLGWLTNQELVYTYQKAQALIFPSLHEGFGLPIVEAMACGCPVACSNTTSCSEVAGEAAVTFDPENAEEIAARIEMIWTDDKVRQELVAKGLERSRLFSCERMAEETLAVFNSVCQSSGKSSTEHLA